LSGYLSYLFIIYYLLYTSCLNICPICSSSIAYCIHLVWISVLSVHHLLPTVYIHLVWIFVLSVHHLLPTVYILSENLPYLFIIYINYCLQHIIYVLYTSCLDICSVYYTVRHVDFQLRTISKIPIIYFQIEICE
jgi:hypothetical protein